MKFTKSILCITAFTFAHAAFAQDGTIAVRFEEAGGVKVTEARPVEPNTYGTATLTRLYVPSVAFLPRGSGTTWGSIGGIGRYASAALDAPVLLPPGASVEKIGIRGCDTSTTDQIQLIFAACNTIGGSCSPSYSISTGTAAAPGCTEWELAFGAPMNVSATANRITAFDVTTGNSPATTFDAAFVDYRLRISDPPVTPTFTDVPANHLFFQYIEALKAAGITSGCTPTTYCPGQAVTRAEMAAFLARALGLHWAP